MSAPTEAPQGAYAPGQGESLADTLRGLATLIDLDPANAPKVVCFVAFQDETFDVFGNIEQPAYQRIIWTEVNKLLGPTGVDVGKLMEGNNDESNR
jgi:hypothetical protein